MKIKELVQRLEAHPNQDAEINLSLNVINTDLEAFDEEAELDIISEDAFYDDFVDIIITPKVLKHDADIENSIQDFLQEEDKIFIEVSVKDGIFITDKKRGLLRETEFNKDFISKKSKDEVINEIVLKLRKML